MYAHSLNVCEEDLLDEMSYPSNNDFLMYVLINRGVSGNMGPYYEMAHDSDLITWENLLLRRRRQFGKKRRECVLTNCL